MLNEDTHVERLKKIKIKLPKHKDEQDLMNHAINHYDLIWSQIGKNKKAQPTHPRPFMKRISRNYLRHNSNVYEPELARLRLMPNSNRAYNMLRGRVEDEISKQYPHLD